jgi:hypothetical protein
MNPWTKHRFPHGLPQLADQLPSAQPNPDATDHADREKQSTVLSESTVGVIRRATLRRQVLGDVVVQHRLSVGECNGFSLMVPFLLIMHHGVLEREQTFPDRLVRRSITNILPYWAGSSAPVSRADQPHGTGGSLPRRAPQQAASRNQGAR